MPIHILYVEDEPALQAPARSLATGEAKKAPAQQAFQSLEVIDPQGQSVEQMATAIKSKIDTLLAQGTPSTEASSVRLVLDQNLGGDKTGDGLLTELITNHGLLEKAPQLQVVFLTGDHDFCPSLPEEARAFTIHLEKKGSSSSSPFNAFLNPYALSSSL